MKDYYQTLGVNEDASNDQIKKAFKDIAKKEHPDRGGNETVFKEANEAYDTLKNSQKRHDYDTMRKFGGSTGGGGQQHPFFNEEVLIGLSSVDASLIITTAISASQPSSCTLISSKSLKTDFQSL